MPDHPLAYFITFTTDGTWLHGDEPGSVDRERNQFGSPWLPVDPKRRAVARGQMTQDPFWLDTPQRGVTRDAIVEECQFRGWSLLALHVRSNHVHLVVNASREPEFVMRSCKAAASKRLNEAGFDHPDRKRWTAHGSTKYLWHEDAVASAVSYTLYRQGEPMAMYAAPESSMLGAGSPVPSSPVPSSSGPSPSASEG
ncbi:MAG: transposase [Planctomycetes bacterium]|nr:transposase [Planctomycetota bacterium]